MKQLHRRRQPFPEILSRVSAELTDLAECVEGLHSLVENLSLDSTRDTKDLVLLAQSIDMVEQRLSDLSNFLSELSRLAPKYWSVETHHAAKTLKLAALAARLSHCEPDSAGPSQPAAGEFELL